MLPPPLVRAATRADLDLLAPLFADYRTFYGLPPAPGRERAFLAARLGAEDSRLLLAEGVDGWPLGFAQMYLSWSSLACRRLAILNDLYVVPASRRRGIGRDLVRACQATAAQLQAARLVLETAPDNRAAQTLYAALDFRPARDLVAWAWAPTALGDRHDPAAR